MFDMLWRKNRDTGANIHLVEAHAQNKLSTIVQQDTSFFETTPMFPMYCYPPCFGPSEVKYLLVTQRAPSEEVLADRLRNS